MFTVAVSDFAMIAHSLAGEKFGPARQLHGATLTFVAEVRAHALDADGIVMDIGALRTALRAVAAELDYGNLDEHPAFPGRTSTTERIAEYVTRKLEPTVRAEVGARGASLRVVVHESPVAWVACERPLG